MSEFSVVATIRVRAYSAEQARQAATSAIRAGVDNGLIVTGEVNSVDAYVAPRTYTQAEFDAAVLAAAEGARQNALAGTFEASQG